MTSKEKNHLKELCLGEIKHIKILLLAGGDLMASFGHPGVWTPEDVS